MTAKDQLKAIIDAQPDDATFDEILHELALNRMIDRGLADSRAGRTISHEDMLRRVGRWQQ